MEQDWIAPRFVLKDFRHLVEPAPYLLVGGVVGLKVVGNRELKVVGSESIQVVASAQIDDRARIADLRRRLDQIEPPAAQEPIRRQQRFARDQTDEFADVAEVHAI